MAVVTSNQVAVRPFRVDTSLSVDDLASAMKNALYLSTDDTAGSGWGGTDATDAVLGQIPDVPFEVGDIARDPSSLRTRETITARYYWWSRNARAARAKGEHADLAEISLLSAADLIFFQGKGYITGLVTAREPNQYKTVMNAVEQLAQGADGGATVVTETLSEGISEDLFLWLLYRLQWDQQLSENLYLAGIQEISSLDRQVRGARFLDEASVERIELAALIAVATSGWGPAKLQLLSVNPDAEFAFELYADGGFQPYRRSEYTNAEIEGADQAFALIEDLWVTVLPQLRAAFAADAAWAADGRQRLRAAARQRVLDLIGDE